MKKTVVSCLMFACSFSAFADDVALTDKEAYEFLKPSDAIVYSNWLNVAVTEEAKAYLHNDKSFGGLDLKARTAKSLTSEFEKNEIVATDKYKGAAVRVKGVIRSVALDAFGNGVINVGSGPSPIGNVIASVNKNDDWVRAASKGDEIDLICNVNKYIMLNISANCDQALKVTRIILMKEYGLTEKFELPKTYMPAALALILKLNEKELVKSCQKNDNECVNEYRKLTDGKVDKTKLQPQLLRWMSNLPQGKASGNTM